MRICAWVHACGAAVSTGVCRQEISGSESEYVRGHPRTRHASAAPPLGRIGKPFSLAPSLMNCLSSFAQRASGLEGGRLWAVRSWALGSLAVLVRRVDHVKEQLGFSHVKEQLRFSHVKAQLRLPRPGPSRVKACGKGTVHGWMSQ